jgi:hypothetical protein
MNWQAYWKGILTLGGTTVGNAIVTWVASGQPWPTNGAEWLQWAVTILGPTVVVVGGPANASGKHEASA